MLRLSKRKLRRWLLVTPLVLVVGLGLSLGLYRLGLRVTPPGNPPVIYAPAVQRTERYRRQASAWLAQMTALDAQLVTLLTDPTMDVYALSQSAQDTLEKAASLDQAIALTYPQASLVSLRDGLQETSGLYLGAAVLLNRWVGEPTPALYLETLEALRVARSTRAVVADNPWLNPQTPVNAPTPVRDVPLTEPRSTTEIPVSSWGE